MRRREFITRAASGHATAALPSVMNSRRLIHSPDDRRVEAIVAGETRGRKPPAKVRCGRKAEKLKTSEYRANPASGRRAGGCDISIGLGGTNGPESHPRSNDRRERDRRKITGNHRRGTDPDRDLPEVEEGVS